MTAVVVMGVGAVAFFAGVKYQESQRFSGMMGQFGQLRDRAEGSRATGSRIMFGTNGNSGMRQTVGEIVNIDSESITVKMSDGSTRIVLLTKATTITEAAEVSQDQLVKGAKIAVFGSENSDGSVTAQTVQLNPLFQRMGATVTPPAN